MKNLINIPEIQTLKTLHNVAKIYPNFTRVITFHNPITVKTPGFELSTKQKKSSFDAFNSPDDSIRRSKTIISDIVLANPFDLFVTFTFASDRYDIDKVKKRMSKWLHNQTDKYGQFSYLIVPERHKDGAIHFHALFYNYKGRLKLANTKQKEVYNITSYRLGFSTAKKINYSSQDIKKVSNYIKKYITKDMPTTKNKKRFWTSNGLIRPYKLHNINFASVTDSFNPTFVTKDFTIWDSDYKI